MAFSPVEKSLLLETTEGCNSRPNTLCCCLNICKHFLHVLFVPTSGQALAQACPIRSICFSVIAGKSKAKVHVCYLKIHHKMWPNKLQKKTQQVHDMFSSDQRQIRFKPGQKQKQNLETAAVFKTSTISSLDTIKTRLDHDMTGTPSQRTPSQHDRDTVTT